MSRGEGNNLSPPDLGSKGQDGGSSGTMDTVLRSHCAAILISVSFILIHMLLLTHTQPILENFGKMFFF